MANFILCSIKNRLVGEEMLGCLEQYIALYNDTLAKGVDTPKADKWIFGTAPKETVVLLSGDELKIRELLCKKAFKLYLKSVVAVLLNFVCSCYLLHCENDFMFVSFGLFVISCLEYTKSCKDWLFQDKQKNWLSQNEKEN